MAIKTPWLRFDEEWNLLMSLASLTVNNWTVTSAYSFKQFLLNPDLTQKELSKLIGKPQSSLSESLKRAGSTELSKMISRFEKEIKRLK